MAQSTLNAKKGTNTLGERYGACTSINAGACSDANGQTFTIDAVDKILVRDLRAELQNRGINMTGRKKELQKRLREYLMAEDITKGDAEDTVEANRVDEGSSTVKEDAGTLKQDVAKMTAEQSEKTDVHETEESESITADQRAKMEANRRRALEIRARKKLKVEATTAGDDVKRPAVTPGSEESAKKMPFNPYKKVASSAKITLADATACPVAATRSATATPPHPKPMSASQLKPKLVPENPPPVTSAWGDCRLDLYEALCTCDGRNSLPDTRMCSCSA
eukprot:CAMPEP_0194337958 /NCGR_PEP_ID=MMETSP0171-20130528/77923_1 /TAXON_ID=218684 /ORGANISM="Corethron pennatum, Strain L29A3" /LENGTH=278 /DNA_ID=CAMNT_0039101923 /DNA_START=676 /DNA_END=1509 /DNA_ORIENTATION=+